MGAAESQFPGVTLRALWDSPMFDDDDGFLHVDRKFGNKKFLLAVFFLGGLIRYLTSASYRKFLSEVFDPVEW